MEEFPWPCEFCERRYRVRGSLRDHLRLKHNGKKLKPSLVPRKATHPCHVCGQDFRFKESLNRHLEEKHPTEVKRTRRYDGKLRIQKREQKESNQSSKKNKKTESEDEEELQPKKCALCLGLLTSRKNKKDEKFENHLSMFFLVYSLLGIPSELIENYLVKYGNPTNWMVLCKSCNEISQTAEDISKTIAGLKNELSQLKSKILVPLSVKLERGESGSVFEEIGEAAVEIREYIQSSCASRLEDSYFEFCVPGEDTANEDELYYMEDTGDFSLSPHSFIPNSDLWDAPEDAEEYSGAKDIYESEEQAISSDKKSTRPGSDLVTKCHIGNTWQCPECPKTFKKQNIWRNHISRQHNSASRDLRDEITANQFASIAKSHYQTKSVKSEPKDLNQNNDMEIHENVVAVDENSVKTNDDWRLDSEQWRTRPRRSVTLKKQLDYSALMDSPEDAASKESDSDWSLVDDEIEEDPNYDELDEEHKTSRGYTRRRTHSDEDSSDKLWQCNVCFQNFRLHHSTQDHVRKKHAAELKKSNLKAGTFCKYLGDPEDLKFSSKDEETGSKKWQCTICLHTFRVYHSIQDHVRRKHTAELQKSTLKVGECCKYLGNQKDEKISRRSRPKRHRADMKERLKSPRKQREETDSKKLWECTICSQRFVLLDSTRWHVRKKHPKELEDSNDSPRAFCKYFGNLEDEKMSRRHRGDQKERSSSKKEESDAEKLWQCTICLGMYINRKTVQEHARKKHALEIEKSELPTRMFTKYVGDPEDLEAGNSVWDWKCTVCDKRFPGQESAQKHCNTEHQEEQERAQSEVKNSFLYEFVGDTSSKAKWECHVCKEAFYNKGALHQHLRMQHDIGSRKPAIMDKTENVGGYIIRYSSESAHAAHPYKCHSCPKSYFTLNVLTDHIRAKHRKNVYLPTAEKVTLTESGNEDIADTPVSENTIRPLPIEDSPVQTRTQVSNQATEAGVKAKSLINRATKFLRKNTEKAGGKCPKAPDSSEDMTNTDDMEQEEGAELSEDVIQSNLFYRQPRGSIFRYKCLTCDPERPHLFRSFDSLMKHCEAKHFLQVSHETGPCKEWTLAVDPVLKLKKLQKDSATRDSSKVPYTCNTCGFKLNDIRHLPLHMRRVHGVTVSVRRPRPTMYKGVKAPEVKEKRDWLKVVEEYRNNRSDGHRTIAKLKRAEGLQHKKIPNLFYLSKRHNVTEFPCGRCNEVFDNYHEWNKHDKTSHFVGFKCDQCGQGLAARQNLENHIRSMHLPTEASMCKGCNIPYKKQEHYLRHIRYDAIEDCKAVAIPCPEKACKRRLFYFCSQEFLDIHKKVYHEAAPAMPFKCSKCPKSFNFKIKWIEHENTHLGTDDCICEHCGKTFAARGRLRIHIRAQHGVAEEFPCDICKRIFPSRSGLIRHKKLHLADNPYMCSVCGKTFKLQNYLTIHMWSHDPDRHKKYSLYKPRPNSKYVSSSSRTNAGKRSKPRVSIILPPGETIETVEAPRFPGPIPKRVRRKKCNEIEEASKSVRSPDVPDTDDSQSSQDTSTPDAGNSSANQQSQAILNMPHIGENTSTSDLYTVNVASLW